MDSCLWNLSDGTLSNSDQASALHALGIDKWDDCGIRKDVDVSGADVQLRAIENALDAQPTLQIADVPLWVDDALFGHLDSVVHSQINEETSEQVDLGLPNGGALSSDGQPGRMDASANSLIDLSPFRFSDRLPGILPSGMQLEQLRATNLNPNITRKECVTASASSDSVQVPGGPEYPMAVRKSDAYVDDVSPDLRCSGSFGRMRFDLMHVSETNVHDQPIMEVQRDGSTVEENIDFSGIGSGMTHFPQVQDNLSRSENVHAKMSHGILETTREAPVHATFDFQSNSGPPSLREDGKFMETRERKPTGVNTQLLIEDRDAGQVAAAWNGSRTMLENSKAAPRPSERPQRDQLISRVGSSDMNNIVTRTIPTSNEELRTRRNGTGTNSAMKSEDIKLQRAQRNRESAKRSRLKSKLLHQKMTTTYDRLKDENRALKGLLEKLVEECRSAPREVQDRLRSILHEKQAAKEKQAANRGVLF